MPYIVRKQGEKWCVMREKEDGNPRDVVKCHGSKAEAQQHMEALYANVPDAERDDKE